MRTYNGITFLFLCLDMNTTLVIIPTFNEIENISNIIEKVFDKTEDTSILVVDDSSPDGTAAAVKVMMKNYPNRLFIEERSIKNGLGQAYVHGFRWALEKGYEYIFEMDADFSHDPMEIPIMLSLLKKDCDLVVGSRYVKGINVVNWPLSRILLSYFASAYVRWITRMPIKDTTAGFVGYRSTVLAAIPLEEVKFVGYAFQIEMKYKAWLKNFKLLEHPIIFVNREFGKSKMDGKIIWEALFGVLYLRIRKKTYL